MWSLGLLKTMKDPKYVVYSDHKIVIIRDAYPKAKHHFLVIPKEEIANLQSLESKHVPLLAHMTAKGKEFVENSAPGVVFRYGYHARPSMHRLHLHIISNDMQSPALKTKKHWNSFTTDFFMKSDDVMRSLKNNGVINIPSSIECESFLSQDLKCHICGLLQSNMPKLKDHLLIH